jgi:Ca2+-transporting ATPase
VTVFIVVQTFYLFNCRSLRHSVFRIGVVSNPWAIAGAAGMLSLQAGFVYIPLMNVLLDSAPLPASSWAWALGVGLAAFAAVGLEKRLWHRRPRPGNAAPSSRSAPPAN